MIDNKKLIFNTMKMENYISITHVHTNIFHIINLGVRGIRSKKTYFDLDLRIQIVIDYPLSLLITNVDKRSMRDC